MEKGIKKVPEIKTLTRGDIIKVPDVIRDASGIRIFGKRIKSFIYTTDVSVIRNNNADAILAVYPFTPQPIITSAILMASDVPVFCGVGGGITTGKRVVNLALDAEFKGAMGIVLNAPTSNEVLKTARKTIDIPIIVTVVSYNEDIKARIESGANILSIAAGKATTETVYKVRRDYPDIPIIATGGKNEEIIKETIQAGANGIIYTPPKTEQLMEMKFENYREYFKLNE